MGDGTSSKSIQHIAECSHTDYPAYRLDFGELWHGAEEPKAGANWNGAYRGRPELAESLWSSICRSLEGKKPTAFLTLLSSLRSFWRFLDAYERKLGQSVVNLADIRPEHAILWLTPIDEAWSPPTQKRTHTSIGALLRNSRLEHFGADDFWHWHPYPKKDAISTKDLPSDAVVREALSLLKNAARAIFARWARADALAEKGRNLLSIPRRTGVLGAFDFPVTEADAHATYRALIRDTQDPLPSVHLLRRALGLGNSIHALPGWWPKHEPDHPRAGEQVLMEDLAAGLYPTLDDIDALANLFVARSGWNAATALSIDVSNPDWSQRHGDATSGLMRVEALKERSDAWQWTLALEKNTTGCYRIITTLIERTAPLRELIARNPDRATLPNVALRSPWICAGTSFRSSMVLVREPAGSIGRISRGWRRLVNAHNDVASNRVNIPPSMTPSDWRDIYAHFVFQDSRYSWILVQWALGHKHMRTTRHYLRSRLWRRYSEKKLSELVVVLIDGIEVNARVDATIIRAQVEFNHTPTDADRLRLDDHRRKVHERELSYTGHSCSAPYSPPLEIDPGNPSDGTQMCRRGDRCPSCPQAQPVDSWHMCKRLAELKWLERQLNEVVWRESHYSVDLEALEAGLKQWPADEVSQQVGHWTSEIEAGRHMVLRFGSKQ